MAFRVHLIGAHETNAPWGFECRLVPALEAEGVEVVATDFRRHPERVRAAISTPADLVLVCKGEGIPAEVIASAPCRRALWYAEQIGTPDRSDAQAERRRRELAENVAAFDVVFSHDVTNLDVHRALGARRAEWLPSACVVPSINRPVHTERVHDVTFVGTLTDRRRALLAALAEHLDVHVTEARRLDEMNLIFNRSRVVLNLHLSDLPNTETRVAEVLGSGSCLLTEALSSPGFIEPDRHAAVVRCGAIEEIVATARALLETPAKRAAMAAAGHAHVMAHHTIGHRVRTLLELASEGVSA